MKRVLPLLGLLTLAAPMLRAAETATLTLHADQPGAVISREIYGHFAEHLGHCIYEGLWVGPDSPIPNTRGIRNDVVAALKQLQIPVLRWPGGCFADEYHWKDGIGPREQRPAIFNSHWGGVVENNHFGTHEFLDLVELLGCEAFVSVNVGSGTVQETQEWVEYMTSDAKSPMADLRRAHGRDKPWRVKYIGVGNETWGCGGNMRPEYYADVYKHFNTFIKNYDRDFRIQRIACGPNGDNYAWTEELMHRATRHMNGLSLHHYTLPSGSWRGAKGSATDFAEDQWFTTMRNTLQMETLVTRHSAIMDKYDPEKKVGLVVDEWGTWYDVTPGTNPGFLRQQNTIRDAVVAAVNLHIFQKHADRVTMANIAQMVNVLQAVILTDREKMILTPTYHVFEMFKVHQGATSLKLDLQTPNYVYGAEKLPIVSASASRNAGGKVHLSLSNLHPREGVTVTAALEGVTATAVSGRILTAAEMNAHNTFEAPEAVKPVAFTGAKLAHGQLTIELPARSVVVLEL